MNKKWIRRDRKRFKAQHGMRVSGKSSMKLAQAAIEKRAKALDNK